MYLVPSVLGFFFDRFDYYFYFWRHNSSLLHSDIIGILGVGSALASK